MGHSLLDWSFYALLLVFPVILLFFYLYFGSYVQSWLYSLVSAVGGVAQLVLVRPHQPQEKKESLAS